jgi:hypothetical protein
LNDERFFNQNLADYRWLFQALSHLASHGVSRWRIRNVEVRADGTISTDEELKLQWLRL